MLIHGHLPSKLMDTKISPIVKDKTDDLSSADNYRPIAVTCILSKVFELMILDGHKHILDTTANQFRYKPKHGTEFCIFVAKQVIDYYIVSNLLFWWYMVYRCDTNVDAEVQE